MFTSRNEMIEYFRRKEENKYLNWNQNKQGNNNNDFDNNFSFTNYVPLKYKPTTKQMQIQNLENKISTNINLNTNKKTKNFSPYSKSTIELENDNTFSNYSHINKHNPNIETSRILLNYKSKKKIPRWDYLYLTSKSPKTKKYEFTTKQIKDNKDWEECTFKPEVNDNQLNLSSLRTARKSVNKVEDRMQQWDKQNKKRIKEMKNQLDEKKFEDCVFKPNVIVNYKSKAKNYSSNTLNKNNNDEKINLTEMLNVRKKHQRSYSNNYNLGKSHYNYTQAPIYEYKLKNTFKKSKVDNVSNDKKLKHLQNSSFSGENPNDTSIYDLKDISLREYTHKKLYSNNGSWFTVKAFKRPVTTNEMKEILDQYNSNSNVSNSNINLTDENDQFKSKGSSDDMMNKFIKPTTSNYSFYSCKDSLFKVDPNLAEYERSKDMCLKYLTEKERKFHNTNLNSSSSTYTSNSIYNQNKLKKNNKNNKTSLTNKTTNKSTPYGERSMISYNSKSNVVPIHKKLDSKNNFIMNPLDYVYENKNKELLDKEKIMNEKNFYGFIEKLHNDIKFLDI